MAHPPRPPITMALLAGALAIAILAGWSLASALRGDSHEPATRAEPSPALAPEPTATPTAPPAATATRPPATISPMPVTPPATPTLDPATFVTGDQLLHVAEQIAPQLGISVEEALRRLRTGQQQTAAGIDEALHAAAGSRDYRNWIQHHPDHRMIYWLHGDEPVPPAMAAIAASAPGIIEIRTGAKYTTAELQAAAYRAISMWPSSGDYWNTAGVDPIENRAVITVSPYTTYADDSAAIQAWLTFTFGDMVRLEVEPEPDYPAPVQPSDWLPRVKRHGGGYFAAGGPGGRLVREGNCLYAVNDEIAARALLIFERPRQLASFDDQANELLLHGTIYRPGDTLVLGPWSDASLTTIELSVPPHPSCDTSFWALVH